jgi:hypothetical protein
MFVIICVTDVLYATELALIIVYSLLWIVKDYVTKQIANKIVSDSFY